MPGSRPRPGWPGPFRPGSGVRGGVPHHTLPFDPFSEGVTGRREIEDIDPVGDRTFLETVAQPRQDPRRQRLLRLDGDASDNFGFSVGLSGNIAVVGAPFDEENGGSSGSAYVFRRDDNLTPSDVGDDFWVQQAMLAASDGAIDDDFGASVAISGNRAIVGAAKDDDACSGDEDPNCNSGSAYVFRRDDNGTPLDPTDDLWLEEDKLMGSATAPGDMFGMSVSISGDLCVVGSWLADSVGVNSGAAYVFRREDNGTPFDQADDFWVEESKLVPLDGATQDQFGISVSIDGERAIVGAWLDNDAGSLSGSAYVFRRIVSDMLDESDVIWKQEAKLVASDASAGDEFGKSVSIHGNWVAVGAFEDDDACADDPSPNPECDSGSAYVFRRFDNGTPMIASDDSWVEAAKLTASDAGAVNYFGDAVAIEDTRVLIGAWGAGSFG
ncbi:MAG: FG-GAP repeat protein, partial [Proteobacteria bacterium]|nr:FG-GAP repeat protein [Pseudomonadota bacterium]